jgi:DNA-3-methyladenine glycosylase I
MMIVYHDEEWGVPVHDDRLLLEAIILDGAQAGLSWSTILHKRENYRKAFHQFDPRKVASYKEKDVKRLLADPGVVRNRLKIASAINNSQRFLEIHLVVRRRQAHHQQMENPEADARHFARIRRSERRPESARLQIRRLHHYLRFHAGRRHGE